jgi:hypothetical protein
MFRVSCPGCGSSTYTDVVDFDAALNCLPDGGCCLQDHHHGQMGASCAGGHAECPTPDKCPVWKSHNHPGDGDYSMIGPCPGGHCAPGIPGCTVCRPIVIEMMPGSLHMKPVFQVPN